MLLGARDRGEMNTNCWGCGKSPPADGPLFLVCPKCRDHKLIKCNFCSQECFKANWARHEEWHKEQRKVSRRLRRTRPKAEWGPDPPGLSARGQEYRELIREGDELFYAANFHGTFKALREAIELCPEQSAAYNNMGNALVASRDRKGAARYFLLAEERFSRHSEGWADAVATACNYVAMCPDAPRPSWWNDEDLLRLSAEAVTVRRARTAFGTYTEGRPRTAAELRESARCYTRAAEILEARGDTENAEMHRGNAAKALAKMRSQLEALVRERAPHQVPVEAD